MIVLQYTPKKTKLLYSCFFNLYKKISRVSSDLFLKLNKINLSRGVNIRPVRSQTSLLWNKWPGLYDGTSFIFRIYIKKKHLLRSVFFWQLYLYLIIIFVKVNQLSQQFLGIHEKKKQVFSLSQMCINVN